MKKLLLTLVTLCVVFSVCLNTASAQCNDADIQYTITQPTTVGGTGSVTFYAADTGYVVIRNVGWVGQMLFSGTSTQPATYTGLTEGKHTFMIFKEPTPGTYINWWDVSFLQICTQKFIDIKVTNTPAFTLTTTNADNCTSNGTVTVAGLPINPAYGIKFPGQTVFISTGGAVAVTSPAGLNLKPGNYNVVVKEDIALPASQEHTLPFTIGNAQGNFNCSMASISAAQNSAPSTCSAANGSIIISGIPNTSGPTVYAYRIYPANQAPAGGFNNVWTWNTTMTTGNTYTAGQYYVEVIDDAANPTTANKVTLPVTVGASCLPAGNAVGTTTTTNSNGCPGGGAVPTTGNGIISATGLQPFTTANGYNTTLNHTLTTWFAPSATGTGTINTLPNGFYAFRFNDNVSNAGSSSYMLATVVNTSNGCPIYGAAVAYTSSASCGAARNGTLTLNNLPSAVNAVSVRMPGATVYTNKPSGSSWGLSFSLVPGNYYVIVNSAASGGGVDRYIPFTVAPASGPACALFTPAAANVTITPATNCNSNNAQITVSGFPVNQSYAVQWPGTSSYMMLQPGQTSISTPTNFRLAPGTYTLNFKAQAFGTATSSTLSVTIPSATGACPKASSAYTLATTNASHCSKADGTITVNGFTANEAVSVRFPGMGNYISLNAATTSITSPIKYAPGTYTVVLRTNAFNSGSTSYSYIITVNAAAGTCNGAAPTLSTVVTNPTNCTSNNGRIRVNGFNGGSYGVIFPGQNGFSLPAPGQNYIISPPTRAIGPGSYNLIVSSNVHNPNATITYLPVTLVPQNGANCNVLPSGVGEDPECSTYENAIFVETFGRTNAPVNANMNAPFPAGATTEYVKLNLACDNPQDDYYAVANTTDLSTLTVPCPASNNNRVFGNFQITNDHTGDLGGNFMIVNGAYTDKIVYERTISGLCPGARYTFSAYIKDLEPYLYGTTWRFEAIRPALSFWINNVEMDRDTLSGAAVYEPATTAWQKVGFTFLADATGSALFTLRNGAPGGVGNDFAIDDIAITKCMPRADLSVPITCPGDRFYLRVNLYNGDVTNPTIRWYRNSTPITSWLPTPQAPYLYTGAYAVGDTFRVELAENNNTANATCIFRSAFYILRAYGPSCVVLPTNTFNFTVATAPGGIKLNWAFANALNTHTYIAEVSSNGTTFTPIGTLSPSGIVGNAEQLYHSTQQKGILYYRVKAVLNSGATVYSDVRFINQGAATDIFTLVNNTVANGNPIKLQSTSSVAAKIQLSNSTGAVVQTNTLQLGVGTNQIQVPKNAATGLYLLSVQTQTGVTTFKIFIQ
jgi:hypothetical protein